jgi:hypothetical protein
VKKNFVVLEKWRKGGFTNRLVTDGKRLRLEYFSSFFGNWRTDTSVSNQKTYLKVFR